MNVKLGFYGGGKMAEGILAAAAKAKGFSPQAVLVAERSDGRAEYLRGKYGVLTTADARDVAREAPAAVLAVKPQDVAALAHDARPCLRKGFLLVSIAAGKTMALLRRLFGKGARIVRVMPNLALLAGEGMSAIAGSRNAAEEDLLFVENLLGAAGRTVRLPENRFDAVTALSGSGPAFFAYMEECMAAAGAALGLPRAAAALLARQTMFGTAAWLRQSGSSCGDFINAVSSKGGTTAAGMERMLRGGEFAGIVAETLRAAAERSKELAKA